MTAPPDTALTPSVAGGRPAPAHLRELAVVLVFFATAAIAMTWPLAAHLTTHLPGDGGDAPMFVWNLWWVKHALLDLRQWPWTTNYIFYPEGVNLSFHTLTTLHGLLSIPIQLVASPIVAANLLFLWSLTASGVGAWALARDGGASRAAALVAGAVFAFSPYVFAQARGHYNLAATWMLPLYVLCLLRALDTGRLRWAVAAGAALAAMTLNEYQYGAFGLLLLLIVVPLRRRLWPLPQALTTVRLVVVIVSTTVALLSPLLVAAAAQAASDLPVADSLETAVYFSADLTGFGTPSGLRWGGRPETYLYASPAFLGIGGADGTVYLGWAAIMSAACAVLDLTRSHRSGGRGVGSVVALWAVVGLVFMVLALGPYLHVFGRETFTLGSWTFSVPLPYLALSNIPVLGTTRVPSRHTVMVMLALAILAAAGVDILRSALASHQRSGVRQAAALVPGAALTLIWLDVGVAPLWLQSAAPNPFYQHLVAEPGDFAIVELPLGQSVGPRAVSGQVEPLLQYFQTVHGKRLFNGHVSRERPERVEPLRQRPGLGWLITNGATLPGGVHTDPAEVQAAFRAWGIRYAIIHPAYFADLSAKSRVQEYLESYLNAGEVYRDEEIVAYRIGAGVRVPLSDGRITLRSPAPGGVAESRTPVLRWSQEDRRVTLEQVQISLDRDFGPRGFLYFETLDNDAQDEPHSYRVPSQYPLQPGTRYYWRVRALQGGTPGLWSAVGAFWTPEDAGQRR